MNRDTRNTLVIVALLVTGVWALTSGHEDAGGWLIFIAIIGAIAS